MTKRTTKQTLLRAVLILLILSNMVAIYFFSAQSGEESAQTSSGVTAVLARLVIPDFKEMTEAEQAAIIHRIHPTVRKLAHMTEFGALSVWCFLLLMTYSCRLPLCYAGSCSFALAYAVVDELHQRHTANRSASAGDVCIDLCGALICGACLCAVILLIRRWKQHPTKGDAERIFPGKPMKIQSTYYSIPAPTPDLNLRIAVASDLHNNPHEEIVQRILEEKPDMILIPGDLMDDVELQNETARGYAFLKSCSQIAPTYYSLGNHEIACYHKGNPWRHPRPRSVSDEVRARIRATGARLLDNESAPHGAFSICGLTSGINGTRNEPDAKVLHHFSSLGGIRLLLCHHPEYFVPYIQKTDIELTVCGHAHGGHWRIFGRGIYAPGQGLFPKYTSGVLENRCVISRGLGNHTKIPRMFNRPELIIIQYGS